MSADFIARLRAGGKDSCEDVLLMRDAANEIERLREALKGATVVVNRAAEVERENERLRAALAPFATEAEIWPDFDADDRLADAWDALDSAITVGDLRRAREALEAANV